MSTPARLRPGQILEAVGYIRVSRKSQAEGYSPDTQREQIQQLARQQGYFLDPEAIFEDHERGSNVSRAGYQEVIDRVRAGVAHAVLVFMFDRWGRDGGEWISRAREFERLGVPIISAQEGRDEGGLIRFVRAGMAEQFSRDLAKKVRPNREAAARRGVAMGKTPYGYGRVYPPRESTGRPPAGRLVPDDGPDGKAWVVRELFTRYAAGGWSQRSLALWLNTDPRVGPPPELTLWLRLPPERQETWARPTDVWTGVTVRGILRNTAYRGATHYNQHPSGIYERATEPSFVVEDAHPPLVSRELWEEVQHRMTQARPQPTYNLTQTQAGHTVALGSGLVHCQDCGGPMHAVFSREARRYLCNNRGTGIPCMGHSVRADTVHAALLAELRRLRGAPWTPQAERRLLTGNAADSARLAALATALDDAHRRRKNNLKLIEAIDTPTPTEIADFRERGAEIAAEIATLNTQLQGARQTALALPGLRQLHQRLTTTEIRTLVDTASTQDNQEALRALALLLVSTTRIVDRRPEWAPTWIRLEVTWAPDIQTLLDAGLLRLGPQEPAPYIPTRAEKKVEWNCQHNERRRAQYGVMRETRLAARRASYARRRAEINAHRSAVKRAKKRGAQRGGHRP